MKKSLKYYIHRLKRPLKSIVEITDDCIGCGECFRVCPMPYAIVAQGDRYTIDKEICMRCAKCVDRCSVGAVVRR